MYIKPSYLQSKGFEQWANIDEFYNFAKDGIDVPGAGK